MTTSLLATVVLTLGGLLGLVAVLMFGSAIFETIAAVFRVAFELIGAAFRFVGNSILALGWSFIVLLVIVTCGAGWLGYIYWVKPGTFRLASYRPAACTELLDRRGQVLDYLCPFDGVRVWRPLESISTTLRMLVVMLEDDKFYEHAGLDFDEIMNSIEEDLEKKKLARGGSTITQQLAKNLFLTKDKSIFRKASEVPLAMRLEKELTKDQILELYLNTIEWGPGVYGVEAASRLYFDKESQSLRDEEAWLLALMIPNPKELNLWVAPKARKSLSNRAQRLAARLYQEHRMSKDEAKAAYARFEQFLDQWVARKPLALRAGRKFPARWAMTRDFVLAEVVSIRRGANGIMKKIQQSPLVSNLDREVQEKLETVQPQGVRMHELSNVVALMDGEQIRALIPIVKSEALAEVNSVAATVGLKTQVFPARSIPTTALWP